MARRGRRGKKKSGDLTQWGYPTNKELRQEAAQIANASVPTVKATKRPYKRQQQAVSGWLEAVLSALNQSSGQATAAYTSAESAQAAVDKAAQARLAGLGLGEYATGAQAVQGAVSDSAQANLISRGAAAEAYASAQPGVATGYSNVQHATVQKALQDALAQRRDLRAQAYGQAMQTVQANALNRASFLAGRQDAATQRRQYHQSLLLQQQQLTEQQREFDLSRQDQRDQFAAQQRQQNKQFRAQIVAQYGYDPVTHKYVSQTPGGKSWAEKMGITQGQFNTMQQKAFDDGTAYFKSHNGASFDQLSRYLNNKYPRGFGSAVAASVFSSPPNLPPKPQPPVGAEDTPANQATYRQALGNWNALQHRYQMVFRWYNQRLVDQQTAFGAPAGPGRSLPKPH